MTAHASSWYEQYAPRQLATKLYSLIPSQLKNKISTDNLTQQKIDTQLKTLLEEIEQKNFGTYNQWQTVKELISQGANINMVTNNKNSILHLAYTNKNKVAVDELEIIKTLEEKGINQNLKNIKGYSALETNRLKTLLEKIEQQHLGTYDQWQEVKKLISNGADSNITTEKGKNTALDLAIKNLTSPVQLL